MSKKLDTSAITDELTEGSAFFRTTRKAAKAAPLPTSEVQKADHQTLTPTRSTIASQPDSDQQLRRPPDEPTNRPGDRPTVGRGELIRRGFEWYADQLRALKQLSLKKQLDGKPGSMSAMVREALDDYLKKTGAQ